MPLLSSFSLIDTSALLALLALIIPILIHLFNRSRGRVVWVGNIGLIKQAKKIRVTEIKLTQLLLLLLRLLILLLTILFLAQLIRPGEESVTEDTQVYLTQNWLLHASNEELATFVDEHTEHVINLLDSSFTAVESAELSALKELQQSLLEQSATAEVNQINVFARLAELEKRPEMPAKTFVYSSSRLIDFSTALPQLKRQYTWRVNNASQKLSPKLLPIESHLSLALIYDESRTIDAQYIQLAVDYLVAVNEKSFSYQLIPYSSKESLTTIIAELDKEINGIFWLANEYPESVFQQIRQTGRFLINDAGGAQLKEQYRLVDIQSGLVETYGNLDLNVSQMFSNQNQILWQDQFGAPLLVKKSPKHIQWLGRFHPEWTNWVTHKYFPLQLLDLIAPLNDSSERAEIDVGEIELAAQAKQLGDKQAILNVQSLNSWLLFIIVLLWLLERYLAERKVSVKNRGSHG